MLNSEIVITGIGVVSPIGIGREEFAQSLSHRKSGVGPIGLFDSSGLPVHSAAEVRDFDPRQFIPNRKSVKVMARDSQMGVAASILAYKDARLDSAGVDPERIAVVLGADRICGALEDSKPTYEACLVDGQFHFDRWAPLGMPATFPLVFLKVLPNMIASHISIAIDARGPNNTIHHGDLSALLAIIEGASLLERGLADVVLVGGASSQMNPFDWARFVSLGRFSRAVDNGRASPRPFDKHRDGEVRGESAAVLVLERVNHAKARGATIWGTIRGWGRCYAPLDGDLNSFPSLSRAISLALQDAAIESKDVAQVNAHGLGTEEDDIRESHGIRRVLSDVPVTAPKSYFGNTGAAGGAVELAASLVLGKDRLVPPTLHYDEADPRCPINVVRGAPQPLASPFLVAVNWTLAGQAAALVVEVA
ncbi:MAG TPA: beta-ketoacyl-[acyl-carrier-protein] synthase family protein [Thermogutta sp.]|nr:beta-ketoacyl-[acyl-carrier-protein] synthase family protein [Thermogutta sp.]